MIFSLKNKALRLESTNQTPLFHTNTKPQSEARADGDDKVGDNIGGAMELKATA
ncbi:hypothetical protein [Helicobacter magdeburgensis]|uniref:hypothetical protein n=1 Tax=Helicobacter magdeburgensis TaxID=471858 RepID=UPI000AB33F8A|nr:hypothetical protein [Helicobacter magdeburgensis]